MAKSDTFFIRASTDFNGTTYAETGVDLGAYVDALGKSVLRVHSVQVAWGDPLDNFTGLGATADAVNAYQLTTQSQAAMVNITDRSVIASGRLYAASGAAGETTVVTERLDIAPQMFAKGYLVGVEQIYLGVDSTSSTAMAIANCSIVLECSVETLSQSAAMALALSQQ